jgi:hypothetical protein
MRLPRDLSGEELARSLPALAGEHHITIPRHAPLRVGTVAGILADVADHFALSREALFERLFSG